MAAISTLMLSETALRKESFEDNHTPSVPQDISGMSGSLPTHETMTYNSSLPAHESSGPDASKPDAATSPTEASASQPVQEPRSISKEESLPDDPEDSMDIDQPDNDDDGSDNDTEQGEGGASSRKKKGQRFFCSGYPPCNLSFTRSEHLARHIRKHTGERPFQCHCNRRFSRLDNLRQHAQTVHVNEEIPTDSLAATGTRFQRQIRTDRVRPTGRPRTNTMSSTGSHSRGHSRNLSASSIGSTSSNYSTSDSRRRPPPLLMAGDGSGRPKLGLDSPSTPPAQFASFATSSPNDLTTPTSSTFSGTPGSPGFGSTIGSPMSSNSRLVGFFGGSRTPGRRLSVPTGPHPYQFPPPYTPAFGNQIGPPSSAISSNSSVVASPTSSTFGYHPGFHVPSGEDWRRRTWHPSTYSGGNFNYARPATSGLTYSQTPDAPQPAFAQNATAAAGQAPRLPGIESFDHVQQRPSTPPRANESSVRTEQAHQPSLLPAADVDAHLRHEPPTFEAQRPSSYPESDRSLMPGRATSSWSQDTIDQIQQIQEAVTQKNAREAGPTMGPPPPFALNAQQHQTQYQHQHLAQEALQFQSSQPRIKRNGWYSGPLPAARTSPEDSGSSDGVPTPGTSVADVQPAIMHSNGLIEPQHAAVHVEPNSNSCIGPTQHFSSPYHHSPSRPRVSFSERGGSRGELNPLEALVAVATSEKNAPGATR